MTKARKKLLEQVSMFLTERMLIKEVERYYVCTCTEDEHPCNYCQSKKLLNKWRELDRKEKRKK
jgi:hypothetical protein